MRPIVQHEFPGRAQLLVDPALVNSSTENGLGTRVLHLFRDYSKDPAAEQRGVMNAVHISDRDVPQIQYARRSQRNSKTVSYDSYQRNRRGSAYEGTLQRL